MKSAPQTPFLRVAAVACLALSLGACNMLTRLSEVGGGPEVSEIANPTARPNYRPVSMPMPAPLSASYQPNSLWRPGARAFFRDQRASEVGDILTVTLNISDSAALENRTTRERDSSEATGVDSLFGFERKIKNLLPGTLPPVGADPDIQAALGSAHSTTGDGEIDRSESISVQIAAVITQILPNGNVVVYGRQEIRVNSELREVLVSGIARREDIDYANKISHEKIAELRVAYGGRGTLSDLQQPRWGTQLIDVVFPF